MNINKVSAYNGTATDIPLFWYSAPRFGRGDKENFGDLLSKFIVENISGSRAVYTNPKDIRWYELNRKVFLVTGSILHLASRKSVIWGSGMIKRTDRIRKAEFLAVRGPVTRNLLMQQGYNVPGVFGDPAILLRDIYFPEIMRENIGIIPHFVDFDIVNNWYQSDNDVLVIDLLNNEIEPVLDKILSCRFIITSSLHGLIVAHTYGIPAVWVQFSDKLYGDNMKFEDYLTSVGMEFYKPVFINGKLGYSALN